MVHALWKALARHKWDVNFTSRAMPRILHQTRSSAMGLHWLLRRSAVPLHCVLPESVNRAAAVVRETDGARWGKATKLLRVSQTRIRREVQQKI